MSDTLKATVTFKRQVVEDHDADLSYLEQDYASCDDAASMREQDAIRLAAYRRGDWHTVGIRAVATIWIERMNYRTTYQIESPGVWGIESDSDDAYFDEVFNDECITLRADIEAMKLAEFIS